MNLLHVVHYPVFGGPHNQALRLAEPLERHGWHTMVLLPNEPGNAADRLRSSGIDVVTAPLGRLRATRNPLRQLRYMGGIPADVARIRRIIREKDIDLVVLAGHVNVQGAIAARLEGVPVVWQVLDTRTPALLDDILLRLSRWWADAVMTTGSKLAQRHRARLGGQQRVIPFYPPVDCTEFRPQPGLRRQVRQEWDIPDGAHVIGTVGNINPQKGVEYLIRALARVRPEETETRLVVVGSEHDTHQDYLAALRAEIHRLDLVEGRDVIFTGPRADVSRQLQGFDVFAMGSVPHSEGVPTAILEAMATGIPVVATDVGGVSEVVEDGVTGFVVPPLQHDALAQEVLLVLGSEELQRAMSMRSRQQALQRFDVDTCVRVHLEAFEAAMTCGVHRTPRPASVDAG